MSEDRDAKLRERAQQLASESYCSHQNHIRSLQGLPPISTQERILAALRQTEEEALQEGMGRMQTLTEEILAATHAEGERAGREAEREAWAAWCEAEAAGCRALDLPYCERALLSKAAEVRARGSE